MIVTQLKCAFHKLLALFTVVLLFVYSLIAYCSIRGLRHALDYASTSLMGLIYRTQRDRLPPITNPLLLERATVLVQRIKAGDLKSEDLVRAYIERCKEIQPLVNAIVQNRFEAALEQAKDVDRRVQEEREGRPLRDDLPSVQVQPLLGLPFTVKDSVAVSGMYWTAGILSRKGLISRTDSAVVRNLRQAGAIPIALTNVPETCMYWDSVNLIYGRSNNPYDLSRIVGGSSGGEGCLNAAAGTLMGVGTDVAGSIRMPALFNGVFGHKTTPQVVSSDGMFPEVKPALNSCGPITRYAGDLKLFLKTMAAEIGLERLQLDTEVNISQLKVYYMYGFDNPMYTPIQSEIVDCINKATAHLQGVAKEVRQVDIKLLSEAHSICAGIWNEQPPTPVSRILTLGEYDLNIKLELVKWLFRLSKHTLGPLIWAGLEKTFPEKGSDWQVKYNQLGNELKQELVELLGNDGVLIFPVHPESAPKHSTTTCKQINVNYTWIWSCLQVCSTSVPMGLDSNGLPIGFQVIGAPFNDHLTIAVAEELEKNFGGWVPPSPIYVK